MNTKLTPEVGNVRAIALALLVLSAGIVAVTGSVAGQGPEYEVEVTLPDEFVVGENEVEVTVDNTNGANELFSPIIEVPLGSALDATDPDPTVTVNGTEEDRTWQVSNSSYRAGDALFVFGQEVPAGESRTYVFTLIVETAGNRTVEADVRPLYNENVNVRGSASKVAKGKGTLDARVIDPDESPASGATVTVDGASHSGDVSLSLVEGTYTVTATASPTAVDFPAFDVTLSQFEERNVTFVRRADLTDPHVIAYVDGESSVAAGSASQLTLDPGNATHGRQVELSFLLDAGGTSTVAVSDPTDLRPVASRSVTIDSGTVTGTSASNDVTRARINATGTSTVTVEYSGHRVGDADLSGDVTDADAQAIASAAAGTGSVSGSADIDGDGQITAVDAMFVAQYDAGNRDADYEVS